VSVSQSGHGHDQGGGVGRDCVQYLLDDFALLDDTL